MGQRIGRRDAQSRRFHGRDGTGRDGSTVRMTPSGLSTGNATSLGRSLRPGPQPPPVDTDPRAHRGRYPPVSAKCLLDDVASGPFAPALTFYGTGTPARWGRLRQPTLGPSLSLRPSPVHPSLLLPPSDPDGVPGPFCVDRQVPSRPRKQYLEPYGGRERSPCTDDAESVKTDVIVFMVSDHPSRRCK